MPDHAALCPNTLNSSILIFIARSLTVKLLGLEFDIVLEKSATCFQKSNKLCHFGLTHGLFETFRHQ
jgi:hypothetical protein